MGARRKGRVIAFQALYRHEMTGQAARELLDVSWMEDRSRTAMTSESKDFAALLVQGTLEKLAEIDACIVSHLEHWDITRLARVDLALLRVSVYALLFQPSIPSSVTIDEAVDIAKEYGGDASYRFVNGVLDAVRKSGVAKSGDEGRGPPAEGPGPSAGGQKSRAGV
jgi:transcription antitermination protein NusB